MAKIDLHKLALVVGFEVVCVDDDFTNYEYMVRIRDIESMSYVLKIKNKIDFQDVDNIISSITIVLPKKLRKKVKKLTKKKDENNIDNVIDLVCYTISEYKSKTKYSLLNEYATLLGCNLEENGYYFNYKLSKKKASQILALIESKLTVEQAPILGKMHKIEYKIGYLKQNLKNEQVI